MKSSNEKLNPFMLKILIFLISQFDDNKNYFYMCIFFSLSHHPNAWMIREFSHDIRAIIIHDH
jgi:hypothetical protein